MHCATGMVIPALNSLNGVFLLLHACWGTPRDCLHVSCVIYDLQARGPLFERLGRRLTLFTLYLPRDHIGDPFV